MEIAGQSRDQEHWAAKKGSSSDELRWALWRADVFPFSGLTRKSGTESQRLLCMSSETMGRRAHGTHPLCLHLLDLFSCGWPRRHPKRMGKWQQHWHSQWPLTVAVACYQLTFALTPTGLMINSPFNPHIWLNMLSL